MRNIQKKGGYIYITSDEEIKEGDWLYNSNSLSIYKSNGKDNGASKKWKHKIILTDNKDLIKDGVQAIDDEFLEWFAKNPNCEEVEVIPLRKSSGWYDEKQVWHWDFLAYKIVIPKEESLEEAAQNYAKNQLKGLSDKNTEFECINDFMAGYKLAQEQICKSEVIQKIRNSKSDAEAMRIIRTL